jgi:hypothetical protein
MCHTGTKHYQWNLRLETTLVTEQVCVQRFTENSINIAKAELNYVRSRLIVLVLSFKFEQ